MSRSEHPFTGEPVLVDRAEAREILGVTEATFARLCREGRFENMVCEGRHALYRSAELRAYLAQDRRLRGSLGSITNAISEPREAATLNGTAEPRIAPQTRNDLGLGNDTRRICPSCGKPFLVRRSDARTCSSACKKRVWRMGRRAAA
jgi:hypothetical protein